MRNSAPRRKLFRLPPKPQWNDSEIIIVMFLLAAVITGALFTWMFFFRTQTQQTRLANLFQTSQEQTGSIQTLSEQIASLSANITQLESEDQRVKNTTLQAQIKVVEKTFTQAKNIYEDIIDLRQQGGKTPALEKSLAEALEQLGKLDYEGAQKTLTTLQAAVAKEQQTVLAAQAAKAVAPNAVESNTAPTSGYRQQKVSTDRGTFVVEIVTADLNSTRVVVDTASDSTCTNDCPVMSVASYAARSGAFAAINGSYFCPTSYPACAGKTNSFDTLLMNKNKTYFNSDNNVYSTVPAAIFSGNSGRFVRNSSEWGRDTGVDAVIANQPLLIQGGQLLFGGSDDSKQTSKSNRSFIGSSGSTAYMGVVRNSSVAEAALVLHTLKIENALNLDSGGSTAFWVGGYKMGPGRDVPNAVLFVRK